MLSGMGLQFTVCPSGADEAIPVGVPLEKLAEHLAHRKAEDAAKHCMPNTIVIGGDTTVLWENNLLEKPQTRSDALNMLRQISGRTHEVISGICVLQNHKILTSSDISKVSFAPLQEQEIQFYIDNYAPFDKAGSYGIQEWIGCIGINRIEGSFYTVMGLPTHLLWDMLKQITNEIS